MLSKKVYLPILAVAVIGSASVFGLSQVHAQGTNGPFSGLAAAIAQKFNLDQTQVQSTIDQFSSTKRTQMEQNMAQREQDRLTKLVQAGKITEAQKQAILTELAALKSKYNPDNLKNLTADQRKAQFSAEQAEIKAWASANGIDLTLIRPGFGMWGMHRDGPKNQPTASPTPAQ